MYEPYNPKKQSRENKNGKAVFFSFVLIIFVVAFIFLKPYLLGNKKNDSSNKNTAADDSRSTKKMTVEALMERIRKKDDMQIIDMRDAESFSTEHIADAKNVPVDEADNFFAKADKNKTYILIDNAGDPKLEELTAKMMPQNGFNNVNYLAGGFMAWKNQEMPTVSGGDPYSFADQSKVNYISSDDLKKAIDGGEDLYIIDLRKSDTFSTGHIKNSVNIYLGDLESRRSEIPLGKKIILIDNDGLWAYKGAVTLFDLGTFNVKALSDGLDAWKQKGYEIIQ